MIDFELYDRLKTGTDQLIGTLAAQELQIQQIEAEKKALESEIQILTFSSKALSELVKSVSVESLESVEKLITYGLRTTIPDQDLSLEIEVASKRGAPWIDFELKQGYGKAPILESFGGGAAAVISFLLRLLVCKRLKLAPLMLLDEPFSFVSAEYVGNLARLLRELSEKLGMNLLLVTHQPEFVKFAHHAFEAVETSKGTTYRPLKAAER